jgi:multiple sugar transport system ATP-binding protein
MIAGLEEATSGTILINDAPADDMPPPERGVAMVFQDFALYPHMSVGDNIGFPLRLAGVREEARLEQVRQVANALGIGDLLQRRPSQLSGGQRQRVAMGRAIVRRPSLFLMDEPLSNLDSGLRAELRAEISSLVRQLGVTCVYVTHDQAEALTMADQVAILRRGALHDVGTPTEVYGRPATQYVAMFLGSPRMNLLRAEVHVNLGRNVALRIGRQALYLPWSDLRARYVAHFHGERIVLGLRAEALVPVAGDDGGGDTLIGRVRHLEHHGHETLAFVDIGATAVVVDEMADRSREVMNGQRGLRRLVNRFGRGRAHDQRADGRVGDEGADGRGPALASQPGDGPLPVDPTAIGAGRHHRRPADLAVRLAPYPALGNGAPLAVRVRMDALHLFDEGGRRIDVRGAEPPLHR